VLWYVVILSTLLHLALALKSVEPVCKALVDRLLHPARIYGCVQMPDASSHELQSSGRFQSSILGQISNTGPRTSALGSVRLHGDIFPTLHRAPDGEIVPHLRQLISSTTQRDLGSMHVLQWPLDLLLGPRTTRARQYPGGSQAVVGGQGLVK
jgi:hypothetical protein